MLSRRVVLAEYFITDDRTLLFLVREDFSEPIVKEIPKSITDIRNFVFRHFREDRSLDGEIMQSTSTKVSTLCEADYQTFLQDFISPLAAPSPHGDPITQPGDIVWFVPHDFLHYLPLHAVKLEGQYLIDRNPVCYTPSASVMKYCHQKRKGKRDNALILSDPWSYAQAQATTIQSIFPSGHAELLVENATKELLKKKLSDAKAEIDILHIVCHGKFEHDEALKSGIELQDGTLTAEEIFSIELNADLVTLSACESGINENKPGDELIGLTRALIYAGTPSVIVSLWGVDALSTNILLTKFYEKLVAGAIKVDALREAQVELRNMSFEEIARNYYETVRERLTNSVNQQMLCRQIADLCYRNKKYALASELYQELLSTEIPGTEQYNLMESRIFQGQWIGNCGSESYPYHHLYYWASFVLIGDWR